MMMNNAVGFYASPYGPASYSGLPNSFGVNSPPAPHYYNSPYQLPQKPKPEQQQPQQQQQLQYQHRPKSQQNNENITSYKLYDLDTSPQSDIIRLMFSFAGVSYKDKHIKHDEWIKIKEQISFQQLPILRVNNQFRIFQLHAIVRYLAREFHLYGTGKHDHAIVDIILEIARELHEKIFEQLNTTNNHEQALQQLITEYSATYLKQFEELYAIFDRHGPFYLGSQISLADLIVYNTLDYLIKIDPMLLENYPHVKEARRHLEKHMGITSFIKTKNVHQSRAHRQKTPSAHRNRTKSPTPQAGSNRHHHQHRHRSDDRHKSRHHHHHHYHCPYHHRHQSKEQTPLSQRKQQSVRSSNSPSMLTNDKEPSSIAPSKQQSTRTSKSPTSSRKEKESTPISNAKQRLIRSSVSPSLLKQEKGPTADMIPPPPPVIKEHKSESKAK